MKRKILPLLFAAAPLTLAHAGEEALSGAALQNAVAGRTVYINTPAGEVPIRYSKSGHVSGYTELATLVGEFDNTGSRALVGFREQALRPLAELDVRGDALLHHAQGRPDHGPVAAGRRKERIRSSRLTRYRGVDSSGDAWRASVARGKRADGSYQAAKRRSCLPSRTSSMIFAEKASRSEGWRLVMRPWSVTTSSSSHWPPALITSVLIDL